MVGSLTRLRCRCNPRLRELHLDYCGLTDVSGPGIQQLVTELGMWCMFLEGNVIAEVHLQKVAQLCHNNRLAANSTWTPNSSADRTPQSTTNPISLPATKPESDLKLTAPRTAYLMSGCTPGSDCGPAHDRLGPAFYTPMDTTAAPRQHLEDLLANACIELFLDKCGADFVAYVKGQVVLSGFALVHPHIRKVWVLALGYGTQFVTYPGLGYDFEDLVVDCHAEILARRALLCALSKGTVPQTAVAAGAELWLYTSTAPCGWATHQTLLNKNGQAYVGGNKHERRSCLGKIQKWLARCVSAVLNLGQASHSVGKLHPKWTDCSALRSQSVHLASGTLCIPPNGRLEKKQLTMLLSQGVRFTKSWGHIGDISINQCSI